MQQLQLLQKETCMDLHLTAGGAREASAVEARLAQAELRCAEAASELQRLLAHTDALQRAQQAREGRSARRIEQPQPALFHEVMCPCCWGVTQLLTACILQHHLDRAASSLSLMGAAPYLVLVAHQRGKHDQEHAQVPVHAQEHAQIRQLAQRPHGRRASGGRRRAQALQADNAGLRGELGAVAEDLGALVRENQAVLGQLGAAGAARDAARDEVRGKTLGCVAPQATSSLRGLTAARGLRSAARARRPAGARGRRGAGGVAGAAACCAAPWVW